MYDIGEVDGRPYLSMEYIDGEDLASLLRRIGRLPQDKAVEMARQLCAGLAAAHERGVLHRDLKPANVMIDGDGHVRLTDFGIAGTAGDDVNARAGTPGYMAPEQLTAGTVSVQSDLFALGLVLYEMFTGKRGIEAKTVDELLKLHERGLDLSTTSAFPDIDPGDRSGDPALPGPGSGEPPDIRPRGVGGPARRRPARRGARRGRDAVAGDGGRLRPHRRGAGANRSRPARGVPGGADRLRLSTRNATCSSVACPFGKPPVLLEERARTILAALGHTAAPRDESSRSATVATSSGGSGRSDHGADRWAWLPTGRAPAVTFSTARALGELTPAGTDATPHDRANPPATVSGMAGVVLDTEGRLLQLSIVPPQLEPPAAESGTIPRLDAAVRGGGSRSEPVHREPLPSGPARSSPTPARHGPGNWPNSGTFAGARRGRRVSGTAGVLLAGGAVDPAGADAGGARRRHAPSGAGDHRDAVRVALIVVTVVLARNNLRTGRGDRRGATRLAVLALVVQLVNWALGAHHATAPRHWWTGRSTRWGWRWWMPCSSGSAYLALEPMVRRRRPRRPRRVDPTARGAWRDPLVGRDVLLGLTSGIVFVLLFRGAAAASAWMGLPPTTPPMGSPDALVGGVPVLVGMLLGQCNSVILTSLVLVLLMVMIRSSVPWRPLAFAALTVLFALLLSAELIAGELLAFEIAMALAISAFVAAVAWRFGVLGVAAMLYSNQATFRAPIVATFDTWYASLTLTVLGGAGRAGPDRVRRRARWRALARPESAGAIAFGEPSPRSHERGRPARRVPAAPR